MTFTLCGFQDSGGSRLFAFQYVDADKSRTTIVVRADVRLARHYEIRLQELPLICVQLLESLGLEALSGPITLTEDHMIGIQAAVRTEAAKRAQKPPRRATPVGGQAWRSAQP
jgi:hypothetical protein